MTPAHDPVLASLVASLGQLPSLGGDELSTLLTAAGGPAPESARARLVEHHLNTVVDAVSSVADRAAAAGVDAADLFQEGSIALAVAVEEFARRGGQSEDLPRYVTRLVGSHLDSVIEAAEQSRASDEALIRDARLFEIAETGLRREIGREPTAVELAAVLGWASARVEGVQNLVRTAQANNDLEILAFLDDEAGD